MPPQASPVPTRSVSASPQPLCTLAELTERRLVRVTVDSEDILVDGVPRAYRNRCAHQAVPLHKGAMDQALLTCPAHGWRFNLITGQSVDHPAYRLQAVAVLCRGDQVLLDEAAWTAARRRSHSQFLYVGRYGRLGWVSAFAADEEWDTRFRQRVVVETARGLEAAELLGPYRAAPWDPVLGPAGTAPQEPAPEPAGRLLTTITDEQWRFFETTQRRRTDEALPHIERVCAECAPEVIVVDAELLWDQKNLVAYFLGQPSSKLGPLAVQLGRELSLNVQFQPIQDPPPASGCGSCGCGAGGCCNGSGTPPGG